MLERGARVSAQDAAAEGSGRGGRHIGSLDVRFWHLADVPLALSNVCFEGKNGHDAGVTPFPLMTLSGHAVPTSRLW